MLGGLVDSDAVVPAGGGGGAFSGPGDVVSGAVAWFGLRAYNAAYATGSNPAVDLLDQAGANPITINITSSGDLDTASIATWVAAHSVATIKVTTLYDQITLISTHNLVQATLANMPTLVLGPVTGLSASRPAIVFSGSQFLQSFTTPTNSQPITLSASAIRTSGTTATIIGINDLLLVFDTANQAGIYAGTTTVDQSQTDNAWHALQGIANGASSLMNVDGSSGTPANAGSNGAGGAIYLGNDVFSQRLTGKIVEAGFWFTAFTGPNMSSMSSNQHLYWGF